MPHVTLFFDPKKVDPEKMMRLKVKLAKFVADALSAKPPTSHFPASVNLTVLQKEVFVRHVEIDPTDVNALAVEILIEAGERKGRDKDMVRSMIAIEVGKGNWIRIKYMADSCIWLKFCEENSFGMLK